jgi:NHL repeat
MRGPGMSRLIILMLLLLYPLNSFSAESIRLRYSYSLYNDEKGNSLSKPEGVACGADSLVVADTGNGRIVIYTLKNGDAKGGKEVKIPQIVYPVRVIISSKGDILVLDGKAHKIVRLNQEGGFIGYVELGGLPTEGMIMPVEIALDSSGNLYVLDVSGGRVLVLDPDGKFQRQVAFPQSYGFINDMAVDPKGTIYLIDSVTATLFSNAQDTSVFSPVSSSLKEDLKFAGGMTLDPTGLIYISDQNSGGIVVVGHDGTLMTRLLDFGWNEGFVNYPAQICLDTGGDLFIADRGNSRIQEFAPLK